MVPLVHNDGCTRTEERGVHTGALYPPQLSMCTRCAIGCHVGAVGDVSPRDKMRKTEGCMKPGRLLRTDGAGVADSTVVRSCGQCAAHAMFMHRQVPESCSLYFT